MALAMCDGGEEAVVDEGGIAPKDGDEESGNDAEEPGTGL